MPCIWYYLNFWHSLFCEVPTALFNASVLCWLLIWLGHIFMFIFYWVKKDVYHANFSLFITSILVSFQVLSLSLIMSFILFSFSFVSNWSSTCHGLVCLRGFILLIFALINFFVVEARFSPNRTTNLNDWIF